MMRIFLIVLSAVLTIGSAVPYLVEIVRGHTKPRIVSWLTWTILTSIACAASFVDHQYPAAILMLCASVETALVVVLGFRHGDRKFEPIDVVCQIGALIGLVLWFTLDSPATAVLATVAIDLLGAIPTLWHCWQKPHEETWITFALDGVGACVTVIAAHDLQVTAIAYPLYILVINIITATLILTSPHRKLLYEPVEFREL